MRKGKIIITKLYQSAEYLLIKQKIIFFSRIQNVFRTMKPHKQSSSIDSFLCRNQIYSQAGLVKLFELFYTFMQFQSVSSHVCLYCFMASFRRSSPLAPIRGSKCGSYIQIWSFYGKRKCLKRQFVCFKAEQPYRITRALQVLVHVRAFHLEMLYFGEIHTPY